MGVFSIDIQPNSFRIATGGADYNIGIWNILEVINGLDEEYTKVIKERMKRERRSHLEEKRNLAFLENHSGPVNCVRWNPSGTLLASASDDTTIMIWELQGYTFTERTEKASENEESRGFRHNSEHWRTVKVLKAHTAGIPFVIG